MLEFPVYSFTWLLFLFALFGLFITSFTVYEWMNGEEKDAKEKFKLFMASFIAPIFLLFGAIGSYLNFTQTYNFRGIDISQVIGLKVIKSTDEYNYDNSHQVTMNNSQAIQNALTSLKTCYGTSNNHESYSDGYKIKLLFENKNLDKDFFISVYRKSSASAEKSVVMPHYNENGSVNLGEYSCPEFQEWVRKNIDPLFQNKQNQPK